jgi:hypothetical protein
MNRIIALKAENDLAYNDSRRRDISHVMKISKCRLMNKFIEN